MRVGIDFHVADGIYQGSRTHVLHLFSEVIRTSPEVQFYLFLEKAESLDGFSAVFKSENVEFVQTPRVNPIKRICWQLPLLQKKYSLDIFHSQYILPLFCSSAGVVTIHDILFESYPLYFETLFRIRSQLLMRWSAWKAKHIFTVSNFSRKEIIGLYGVAPEKISVIHNGVDPSVFYPGIDGQATVEKRGLRSKKYFLSVGRLEPRKNHALLIEAYASMNSDMPLVIIGQAHFRFSQVFDAVRRYGVEDKVQILQDVESVDLPAFYRHAKLFVYPTWAEGFGIPLIEAMACGIPVVSSNSTAIPEVVADAALLVSPGDCNGLSMAMTRVLLDEKLYLDLQARGIQRAESFRWKLAAEKVRNAYFSLMTKG